MAGVKLDWRGDALKARMRQAAADGIDETTAACVLLAQERAPRDTGFMANTIESEPAAPEGSAIIGRFGNWTADYSLWVEVGTRRMAARPFLRPAADAEFPNLPDRIRANFER